MRDIKFLKILTLFLILISCNSATGNESEKISSRHFSFKKEILATGLENPWSIEFLPDGRVLIAERPGRLRVFENGTLLDDSVDGIPKVFARGQGGLLDIKKHPDFDNNSLLYIVYSASTGGGAATRVSRGKLVGNSLIDVEVIFTAQPAITSTVHFGSRVVFDTQGYMYVAIGDRGNMNSAQDNSNHNGTVVRLYDDGRVPADNPFVNDSDARDEIYTYGHRNIQGMDIHPITGVVWTQEHGPKGGDEINPLEKGGNYGWPLVTHGINYDGSIITTDTTKATMIDPLHHWTPSIAPCGMTIVVSEKFDAWNGDILSAALAGKHVHRVKINDRGFVTETERLFEDFARFRDVAQGPDGYIYFITENPGVFFRIVR